MKENSAMPEKVLAKIYNVAMESVNADLILAICLVESNFNPHVESGKGAVGLMGIMPGVWLEELRAHGIVSEKEDLFTISKNIDAGVYVLENYLGKTDNLKVALSRYAGGDSSYAVRVLRMQKKITLTRRSELNPSLAAVHY
jgi:soluble lytic murein transglycosylase-like protein